MIDIIKIFSYFRLRRLSLNVGSVATKIRNGGIEKKTKIFDIFDIFHF